MIGCKNETNKEGKEALRIHLSLPPNAIYVNMEQTKNLLM